MQHAYKYTQAEFVVYKLPHFNIFLTLIFYIVNIASILPIAFNTCIVYTKSYICCKIQILLFLELMVVLQRVTRLAVQDDETKPENSNSAQLWVLLLL